ncbi:MAG: tryptophan--tRNA ligase [Chlamydiota bacterium]
MFFDESEVPAGEIVLTGDRPTGPLHLGHYVGSLKSRIQLQEKNQQYIMVADAQALTDHAKNPDVIRENVLEVVLDYLAVGIDPTKSTIFIQSQIPPLFELSAYFLNLVTWNRLKHNPTVKEEIVQKGYGENIPAGFMVYPVFQAADIAAFKANRVPVGSDQLPMIEGTSRIVGQFNRTYQVECLVEPKPLVSPFGRLPGVKNKAEKMSKTLGNAIFLKDPIDKVFERIKKMPSDPSHTKIDDPGNVENSLVFTYLDAFDADLEALAYLKESYRKGGLADSIVKKRLMEVLEAFLSPIQKRRAALEDNLDYVRDTLVQGTNQAQKVAANTLREVKEAMGIMYLFQESI